MVLKINKQGLGCLEVSEWETWWENGNISQQVISHAGIGIVLLSQEGICLRVNAPLCRILRYENKELEGVKFDTLLHPDDLQPEDGRHWLSGMRETEHQEKEIRCRCTDGTYHWFRYSLCPVQVGNGAGIYYSLLVEDINQLKQSGNQLELLASALDHIATPLFISDNNGRFVYVNQRASQSLGYNNEELLSMCFQDIVPDTTPGSSHLVYSDMLDDQTVELKVNTQYKKKSGHLFPVSIVTTLYRYQSTRYGISQTKDISDQMQPNNIKECSEQAFMMLVESSPNIIIMYNPGLHCVYVNPSWERISGYTQTDLLYKTPGQNTFLPAEATRRLEKMLKKVLKTGRNIEKEFMLSHACTGQPVYLLVDMVAEKGPDNRISGVQVFARNISELKKKEMELIHAKELAEESSRLKSAFLAIISHEVRTPLNAIIGFTSLLHDGTFTEKVRDKFMCLIEKSGEKLTRIMDDIIDLSRIESGDIGIKPGKCNPQELLRQQYKQAKQLCKHSGKRHLAIKIEIAKSLNSTDCITDTARITQALNILTDNAIKFTQAGEIILGLKYPEPGQLVFYVADTGIGIPVDKQEIIFEPFTQVEEVFTRVYEGLGIGLSIARKIARALGGNLTFVSEPGKGSTFFFSIPVTINNREKPDLLSKRTEENKQ